MDFIKSKIVTSNEQKLTYEEKLKPREVRKLWIQRIFMWIIVLVTLFPIVWIISASLAKGQAFTQTSLFPKSITLDNYVKLFQKTGFLTWVKNSMIICLSVSIIQLLMTSTGAYAFSRMKFKGRTYGLMSLLILQMFPGLMSISAILGIAYKYDLMDKMLPLILLLAGGSAFNIWLLKGYIDGIPKELDEAAMVDGASHWQIFWNIIMPLSKPMIAVIFLFCFIGIYSEFPLTSALIKDPAKYTVTLGLRNFINNQFSANWTQFAAASVVASLPIVVVFLALQKYIAKGLVSGAVKG
ncbi:MAG: sugar ABC transporter permease [Clostridiaceae bacterium]